MLIDWFTVAAQVINFLILVWLLKHFLYKPILDTIDERESKVIERLSDADGKMTEATRLQEDFLRKNQEFDRRRADLLSKARDDVEAERQNLLVGAYKEYDQQRKKFEESLSQDEDHLAEQLISRIRKEVFTIARKVLSDLADARLEESMAGIFIARLRELNIEEKQLLVADFRTSAGSVQIRTAIELTQEQRTRIERTLEEMLVEKPQCRFETMPDLIGGIEVTISGKKLAWSIREYLSSLENDVHEILKRQPERFGMSKPAYELNPRTNVGFQQNQTGEAEHGS